jgi:hypothetical protein
MSSISRRVIGSVMNFSTFSLKSINTEMSVKTNTVKKKVLRNLPRI